MEGSAPSTDSAALTRVENMHGSNADAQSHANIVVKRVKIDHALPPPQRERSWRKRDVRQGAPAKKPGTLILFMARKPSRSAGATRQTRSAPLTTTAPGVP